MTLRTVPALPLAILPLAVALLQTHGIPFWQTQVGWWPGLGWSLLLELISLWLWFRPGWRWWRPMAWAATLLLLAGPLYQVSDPLVRDLVALRGEDQGLAAQVALLQGQAVEAQQSLDRYQRLSLAGRYGWQGKIDQVEAQLSAVRVRLQQALAAQAERRRAASLNWRRTLLIAAQLISLVLFQAAAVLAIRALGAQYGRGAGKAPVALGYAAANGNGLADRLVLDLQQAIQQRLRQGQSYGQIADATGIGKGHLSLLMNHFDRAKRGDRVLGEAALRTIQAKMSADGRPAA
jgi:hypothetical protein